MTDSICGRIQGSEEWRLKHNDVVQTLKSRRFRWAKHVVKMEEKRSSFRALASQLKRGLWVDNTDRDVRVGVPIGIGRNRLKIERRRMIVVALSS